jgi:putative ABC transport system substrate-binding protein
MTEVRSRTSEIGKNGTPSSWLVSPALLLSRFFSSSQNLISDLRLLISVFCVLLFAFSFSAQAQQGRKVFRIGYLDPGVAAGNVGPVEAFRQELAKLGWIEGKNLKTESRFLEQRLDRAPEVAADLVRLNVDLIVVTGTVPATAAKSATRTIPIVMANVGDPLGAGLVDTLAHPGGNVTGVSGLAPELNTKRLEVLKDTVHNLARVAVLKGAGADLANNLQLKELRTAATALKVILEEINARVDANGLESAFQTVNQKQVNALMTTASPRFFAERKKIVDLVTKYRLPAIYFQKEFVDVGGLMSYGVDYDALYRNTAHYVDKILRGSKPGDLPVQQATKLEFVISLRAANQIGLTIPVHVLERADKVIK